MLQSPSKQLSLQQHMQAVKVKKSFSFFKKPGCSSSLIKSVHVFISQTMTKRSFDECDHDAKRLCVSTVGQHANNNDKNLIMEVACSPGNFVVIVCDDGESPSWRCSFGK